MLTLFETNWHFISGAAIFAAGAFIALHSRNLFGVSRGLSISLYLFHSISCIYYLFYSISNYSDSPYYYVMSLSDSGGFEFGTFGIIFITSLLSSGLNLSYGGTFLVYNIIGFMGVLAFSAALKEIMAEFQKKYYAIFISILFLPGIHFWSSAIGKDAPAFLASGLLCWASINIRRRAVIALTAVFIFFLARPHVAIIALASFGCAFVLFGNVSIKFRALLAVIITPIVIGGLVLALDSVGLGEAGSAADVADYLEQRQDYNMEGGGGIDISSMSAPMRVASYLFRPVLFETPGLLGIVIGIENLVLLIFSLFFLRKSVENKSSLSWMAACFMIIFSFTSIMLLSYTTANLGIAIRQKWMFFPMIICLGFSFIYGHPRKRKEI